MDNVSKYAKQVIAGRIESGKKVRQSCQRHLDDIKKSKTKS